MQQGGATPTSKHEYIHRDHIGSVVAITGTTLNSSADVQWQANGAWGERRFQQWNGMPDPDFVPTGIARGFTDHEHLDSVGLIHMNGRVYDPELGRFMSADPFVQAPYNTQSYNRYSYVFNNPLSFTDPSGYTTETIEEVLVRKDTSEDAEALRDSYNQSLSEAYINNLRMRENNLPGNPGSLGGWGSITGSANFAIPIVDSCGGNKACIKLVGDELAKGQLIAVGLIGGEAFLLIKLAGAAKNVKAAEQISKLLLISPTYNSLKGIGIKGFQAHHILPQYLGKMLGYTSKQMGGHPATLISQWKHTGAGNPAAMHKAIDKYLPPMTQGQKAQYSPQQIYSGLEKAYSDIGRADLFNSIKHLIQ